ncbi:hypothetical protein RJ640_021474 [Escallonia rubra]|uniref:Myb-like domain-containing protein n=1 Tax=Escallonia rubra TaxID=112253 RepID=A0AA88QW40_9ASTE|nr:hypothetical protein RJ640_021474 [Escallonia rubra]
MAPEPNDVRESATTPTKAVEGPQAPLDRADDKNKSLRHPRWTRQETLVLTEGKRIAENRGRKGRKSSSVFGSDQLEPKWDYVSSYCRKHGVNRGPVQCRKRWSNLVGDFKKIKAWESEVKEEADSFWMMRNDSKKEKKLPGFFDREVYDVLDGKAFTATAYQLALVTISADAKDCHGAEAVVGEEDEEEEDDAEAIFDSSQQATVDDGLFSDSEQLAQEEIGKSTEGEKVARESPTETVHSPVPISGTTNDKQPGSHFCKQYVSQESCKRRRVSTDGSRDNLEGQLIKVLEKNTSMLNSQLEAQQMNCQLERDQQKDHNDSLVAALNKITDALTRIADKL